uniref:Uncharacterized protein n=1 Tax=Caenorhabditis tropicalis TaxID=1561998 RepID=A0A1I7TV86_9PELO
MKRAQSILLCAAGVLTLVACALILVSSQISDPNADSNFFWPIFSNSNPPSSNYNNGFIFEKIVQQNESSEDMRSPIYLTQQRILLENIGKLQINYHQKSYILNDICYKPHSAIFLQFKSGDSIPHHFQRLLLEIERLSPCLLVTPLNCFLDSYGIHSEISRWYDDTDFLNRRLRNAFIEAQGENEIRPYVISKYGPELIRKWSDLMFKLKSDKYPDFREEDLQERVKMWLNSIEPRHQLCSNPIHSCNETMSAEKYLNMCTEIQQLNSSNLIKYQLKNEDISFISQLDCVDDQDEFIEWMQKREIGEIIKEISSTTKTSYYEENINQECDGIYHDANSSGIPFFKGTKSFLVKTIHLIP